MNLKRSRVLHIALGHKQNVGFARRRCPAAPIKSSDLAKQLFLEFVEHFQQDDQADAILSLKLLINFIKETSTQRPIIFVDFQVNLITNARQIFEDDGAINVLHHPSCWRNLLRWLTRQVLAPDLVKQLVFVNWREPVK